MVAQGQGGVAGASPREVTDTTTQPMGKQTSQLGQLVARESLRSKACIDLGISGLPIVEVTTPLSQDFKLELFE